MIFAADYLGHLIRYLLVAGGAFLLLYVWRNRHLRSLKIQTDYPARQEMRREVLYSFMSMGVFALVGVLVYFMHRAGIGKLYVQFDRHSWGYFWISTIGLILAHDTYFYWTHRLMHWKPLFPIVHKIHHQSHNPTPWAAFSFHPIEAFIEAGIFPIYILFVPTHPFTAIAWLLYMTGMNVFGHCGFEILPKGFTRHWLSRWHNTSVHHNMHHRYVHCNYGLYYNIWDRIMGTNHVRYDDEFDHVKDRAHQLRESKAPLPQAASDPAS